MCTVNEWICCYLFFKLATLLVSLSHQSDCPVRHTTPLSRGCLVMPRLRANSPLSAVISVAGANVPAAVPDLEVSDDRGRLEHPLKALVRLSASWAETWEVGCTHERLNRCLKIARLLSVNTVATNAWLPTNLTVPGVDWLKSNLLLHGFGFCAKAAETITGAEMSYRELWVETEAW